jgi:hypothetical protein
MVAAQLAGKVSSLCWGSLTWAPEVQSQSVAKMTIRLWVEGKS